MADSETADLDAQIAKLQEERAKRLAWAAAEKRREDAAAAKILIGATPTKDKEKARMSLPEKPKQPVFAPRPTASRADILDLAQAPQKSTALERLAARRARSDGLPSLPSAARSTSFKDKVSSSGEGSRPSTPLDRPASRARSTDGDELEIVRTGAERADDLTLDQELEIGPHDFGKDPEGEEVWRALEPNSGIRLSKRALPHEDVQDLIRGRYFMRPPRIYSMARLSRDGATYDIPVEGDWVTIAVVAERGDIRVSGTRDAKSDDDDDDDDDLEDDEGVRPSRPKGKKKGKEGRKKKPRKYINLKLVALPPRNKTLGATSISGDAHLQLLLFESDSIVRGKDDEGNDTKSYRGGSGGAYERWCNLGVGSVIALLNPRVLRPLKAGGTPHPLSLPLALNPASADCISYIGQAMDMGQCSANQRDGSRCRSWIDLRLGQVCEYHVHAAVKRGRGGRGALASATTSFELVDRPMVGRRGGFGNGNANLDKYDPSRKTGLLPREGARAAPRGGDNGGGGATYIVGSGVARIGRTDGALAPIGDPDLANKLGRNTAMKRKRKMEEAEAEAALTRMFEKNGDGTSAGAKYLQALGKAPNNQKESDWEEKNKRVYSAQAIKRIGFDPTGRRDENAEKRLASLASLRGAGNPKLGRGPGPKKLSNVVVPTQQPVPAQKPAPPVQEEDMIDLD